jgi:uncharacterized protein YcbX
MRETFVEKLFVYPIKGLGGVEVESLEFGSFGVLNDRRYMLVNQNYRMITQRSHPILSQYKLEKNSNGWSIISPTKNSIDIDDNDGTERLINTEVWKKPIQTREKSEAVSRWFSEQLDELVHLVEFDDLEIRYKDLGDHEAPLAFADSYPLLICNTNSLLALNKRLGEELSIGRFRPNVVITMPVNEEFITDKLSLEKGGELLLSEPCVRCNVPAIHPETSVFNKDLHKRMQAELRRDGSVVFGANSYSLGLKELRLNDRLLFD